MVAYIAFIHSLHFSFADINLEELRQSFGSSNELIKSFRHNYKSNGINSRHTLLKETQLLASVTYEKDTKWGKEASKAYEIFFFYNISS
jgi:hypothetical protein